MKEIILTNSDKTCLVDDEDFEKLNTFSWWLGEYSIVNSSNGIFIHRLILNLGPVNKNRTNLVDHIDRNILNNQKSNLRICDDKQNSWNRGPHKDSTSKYKGVSIRDNGRWTAIIEKDGKLMKIGTFIDEKDAAIAYDYYARLLFKEFAYLNFPEINLDYYNAVEKNKTKIPKKVSKYLGVGRNGKNGLWLAKTKINKKMVMIGLFESELDAAYGYDKYILSLNRKEPKINFPNFDYSNYVTKTVLPKYSSNYHHVCICKTTGKFKVAIQGKHIGTFKSELIAAEVADYINLKNNNNATLNFPNKDYSCYVLPLKGLKKENPTSKYNCVIKSKNRFIVNIKINKKNFYVGTFTNELDAASTADFWNHKFNKDKAKLNFPNIVKNMFDLAKK